MVALGRSRATLLRALRYAGCDVSLHICSYDMLWACYVVAPPMDRDKAGVGLLWLGDNNRCS